MKKILFITFFVFFINGTNTAYTQHVIFFQPGQGLNDGTDDGSLNAGKDAYFYGCNNDWSGTTSFLSSSARSTCNDCNNKAYMQFNISTLPENVDKVYLGVTHLPHTSYCYSNCSADFYFYPVLSAWNEVVLPLSEPQEGNPIYGPINITFPNNFGNVEYDITETYKQWKDGTLSNHGLVVYSPNSGCNNAAVVWAVDSSDNSNEALRPYLKIITNNTSKSSFKIIPIIKTLLFP